MRIGGASLGELEEGKRIECCVGSVFTGSSGVLRPHTRTSALLPPADLPLAEPLEDTKLEVGCVIFLECVCCESCCDKASSH